MDQKERMRELVANARRRFVKDPHEPFCVIDRYGVLADVDPEFPMMLGYDFETVAGQDLLQFVHPDDQERVVDEIQAFHDNETTTLHLENRMVAKDGSIRWIHWTGVADYDTGNAYAMARDVTEEVELKNALEKALGDAERANRAKTEFLANMSHEIRTPLNAIIGLTDLVLDSKLDPHQQDLLSTIKSSGDHLLTLLNEILDFSKIEAGAMELETRPFSLREALESSLDVVKNQAHAKALELDYRLGVNVPDGIKGDAPRLKQILVNLLGNAIKFTNDGSVTLRCWVVKESPLLIGFEVEDTGIGMSEEQMEQLFQPFHQADASINRKFGGTGLGLSICKKLVDLMGGEISVGSEIGKGTCFNFDIPTEEADVSKTQFLDPHGIIKGKRARVLCDDPEHRRIIEQHLARWNMVIAEPADIIVADMPEHSLELQESIDRGERTITVAASAVYSDAERPVNLIEIIRPAKLTTLHESLLSLLGEQTENQAKSRYDATFAETYPHKILVAEDNIVNQKVIQSMLGKLGYEVDIAANGQEAVNMTAATDYDVVLMDCQMPIMDGMAASKLIRSREGHQPQIIAATAHADKKTMDECLMAGMDGVLMKPLRMKMIAEALSNEIKDQPQRTTSEIIDMERWNEMADLLGDTMMEMLDTFSEDLRNDLDSSPEKPSDIGHKIKGAAYTLGFAEVGRLALQVEKEQLSWEDGRAEIRLAAAKAINWARKRLGPK